MRLSVLVVSLALVAASCGGEQLAPPARSGRGAETREIPALPAPVPATPAFVLHVKKPLGDGKVEKLGRLNGVAVVAGVKLKELVVKSDEERVRLEVGEVEPLGFRPVAPGPTKEADFVWTSLVLGDVVPTKSAAQKLGVKGAAELTIGGARGFKIGAFADNGVPNLADVLVATDGKRRLRMPGPRLFVIGAEDGAALEQVGKGLRRLLPGARLERLAPPASAPTAAPAPVADVGAVSGTTIGTMHFRILEDGSIIPDPAWVAANIVSAEVPVLGTVTCHRLMIPRLAGAMGEIERLGFAPLIRTQDYGGCYVPRFIDRDVAKPLSNHAFGFAIDFNTTTNQLGTKGDMDPRIVEVMARWGFSWGGLWERPDPMHFELTG